MLRKASSSSTQPSETTTPTNSGSLPSITSAKSSWAAVTPPTCTSSELESVASGSTSVRSCSTSCEVSSSCGALSGDDGDHAGAAAAVQLAARYVGDALDVAQLLGQFLEGELRGGAVDLADERQRPVGTGTEPVGEHVVRLPGGRVEGLLPWSEVPSRSPTPAPPAPPSPPRRTRRAAGVRDRRPARAPAGRRARVRRSSRCRARARASAPAASRRLEHPHADHAEQRGHQGHRGEHRQHHGQRGGHGDAVEEAQPQHEHAQQRYAHRDAGEDDGASRPGDRPLRGLRDGQALLQARACDG